MNSLPGPIRVLLDWLIMLMGTIFTFFEKKEDEADTNEGA